MFNKDYFHIYTDGEKGWYSGLKRRQYFYKGIARCINQFSPETKSVAELGCGLGMFSFYLLSRTPSLKLDAVDFSEYAVSVCESHLKDFKNASVRQGDAQHLTLESNCYDVVIALDVVEHLQAPENLFRESARMLKSGGILIFSTPNPDSAGAKIKRKRYNGAPAGDIALVDRWFADRDPTHISIRSISEWKKSCQSAGFYCVKDGTDGLWDTPYTKKVPPLAQKVILNGSQRLLIPLISMLPWKYGETYIGVWKKP